MKMTIAALSVVGLLMSCVAGVPLTGADLIRGNAAKEEGYSEAQLQRISKALRGKRLTFANGKAGMISKDEDDGSVSMMVSYDAPSGGLFKPSFTLRAKITGAQARQAEELDEGARIKSLTGTVTYDPDFFMFFELKDVTFGL